MLVTLRVEASTQSTPQIPENYRSIFSKSILGRSTVGKRYSRECGRILHTQWSAV